MKKQLAVILAFVLPLALILIVAGSVYLPNLFLKTEYDFIYAACNTSSYYDCQNEIPQRFGVEDGKVIFTPPSKLPEREQWSIDEVSDVRFFFHDTEKNESREITFKDVSRYSLSPLVTSPDGVTFGRGWDNNDDFFFMMSGRSNYEYTLSKGRSRSKLYLVNNDNDYYYNRSIHFLGWVLK